MRKSMLFAIVLLAACGDDDDGAAATKPAAPPAAAAAKAAADKNKLQPRQHIEEKVACSVPDAPTGHPACTPADQPNTPGAKLLPDCDPGSYCMQVGATYTCEPCPERESIRHDFKDRDFVEDQGRDPFYPYVITPAGLGAGSNTTKPEPHQSCKRPDQFVAPGYSFQDLKIVGIISQGTVRKVLLMDSQPFGHVVKRGDCVGKEKAVVKDIGTNYITFVVEQDDSKTPSVETSVQLHPGGLDEGPPTSQPNPTAVTPVVPPPVAPPIRR